MFKLPCAKANQTGANWYEHTTMIMQRCLLLSSAIASASSTGVSTRQTSAGCRKGPPHLGDLGHHIRNERGGEMLSVVIEIKSRGLRMHLWRELVLVSLLQTHACKNCRKGPKISPDADIRHVEDCMASWQMGNCSC